MFGFHSLNYFMKEKEKEKVKRITTEINTSIKLYLRQNKYFKLLNYKKGFCFQSFSASYLNQEKLMFFNLNSVINFSFI